VNVMETAKRRRDLLQLLREADRPLTGTDLAARFNVSRQVIVQDIAILRSAGQMILATPQGYVFPSLPEESWVRKTIACQHSREDIEKELGIVVDHGGRVLDAVVEHPVYGELRGSLMISNRRDVRFFVSHLEESGANPLMALTGGVHLHTIEAPDEETLSEILEALGREGFLIR